MTTIACAATILRRARAPRARLLQRVGAGSNRTDKVDFKRDLDCYRAKRDTPQLIEVPDLRYLMLDGHGDPNTPAFADAVSALYPVA